MSVKIKIVSTGKILDVFTTFGHEFGKPITYYHAKNYPWTIDSETLRNMSYAYKLIR